MTLPVLCRSRDLASWGPLRELDELAHHADPLWGTGVGRFGGWSPSADVEESDDAYEVEIELPGVPRDDIDVRLVDRTLTVSGEVKEEEERTGILHRRTRRVGRFHYAVTLPGDVDGEDVSARLHDGVLRIRVPKSVKTERRRIAVGS